jgi:GABA(A) receptor-associated protein
MNQLEERLVYSRKILAKYPDCVPVIIRKHPGDKNVKQIEKERYLIPRNLNISEIVYIIRKHIDVKPEQAIFIFLSTGILMPSNASISEIYELYKSEDQILYITYRSENTFG